MSPRMSPRTLLPMSPRMSPRTLLPTPRPFRPRTPPHPRHPRAPLAQSAAPPPPSRAARAVRGALLGLLHPRAQTPPAAPTRAPASATHCRGSQGFDDFGADQRGDKPAAATAESSCRRKELQQQHSAPWAKLLSQCSQAGKYTWVTYKETKYIVLKVAASIWSRDISKGGRCGIYGGNSPEWVVSMQACNAHTVFPCMTHLEVLKPLEKVTESRRHALPPRDFTFALMTAYHRTGMASGMSMLRENSVVLTSAVVLHLISRKCTTIGVNEAYCCICNCVFH